MVSVLEVRKIFKKKEVIVRYAGGLGNQMFQYALRCNFEKRKKIVKDDVSHYKRNSDAMPFRLTEAFQNIVLNEAEEFEVDSFYKAKKSRNTIIKILNKLLPTTRLLQNEKQELIYESRILKTYSAYVTGYWQSYRYVQNVKEILTERFKFAKVEDEKVIQLVKRMKAENSVSIHIRAGDYQLPENVEIFGGICTLEYYHRAIKIMNEKLDNPLFFVFSNDIQWCKENFPLENVIWMDEKTLPQHEDWVEMYLMSCCKHNIIANSSFSWWAAWLNQNQDKIVIAPKKWLQTVENDEVCPEEWIRI